MEPILPHAIRIAGNSPNMAPKVDYVLRIFGAIYDWWDFDGIGYSDDENNIIRVYRDRSDIYTSKRNLSDEEMTMIGDLPVLFHSAKDQLLESSKDHIDITFDLFSGAFYFLSGWQEYVEHEKDRYGRYPYQKSIQARHNFVTLPVVNYYFEILCDAIEKIRGKRPQPSLWKGSAFGFYLSHDIDQCQTGWSSEVKFALKKGSLKNTISVIANKMIGRDPYFNLNDIAQKEAKEGVAATYFFLPVEEDYGDIKQADYDVSSLQIQNVIKEVKDLGGQVMLHGSGGSSESVDKLLENKERMELSVLGNRFHFLCWSQKITPGVLMQSGIRYDSTLGFAEHIGFRNGICHPFYLYDIEKDQMTNVLEYPLTVMDTTFYNQNYMNVGKDDIVLQVKELMTESIKFRGMISVLWHNNYFAENKYPGWGDVYWEIIRMFKENGGLSIVMDDLYNGNSK